MKNIKILFAVFLLMATLVSCEGLFPCLEGDGNIVSEERVGGTFYEVEANGAFDVSIEEGPISVRVTTDENLQRYIETKIQGGKLVIESDDENCIEFSPGTIVEITVPEISSISLLGSGELKVRNFDSLAYLDVSQVGSGDIHILNTLVLGKISVNLIGSGNVWLNGKALNAELMLSGSGTIEAESFPVKSCTVNLLGSGNIHTFVTDVLNVSLSGSGNVYYYGNPTEVNQRVSGSGEVINSSF